MAVYDPSGSNGVHMDKAISGKKATPAKQTPAKKAVPAKKGAPAKKGMPPFLQPKKKAGK